MTGFFQIISAKITIFITTVIITVNSILPWSATNKDKPVEIPVSSVSSTIMESSTLPVSIIPTSIPKAQNKAENKTTTELIPTLISSPTLAPETINNTSSVSNTQSSTQTNTYPIVPISVMDISSMEPHLQTIAQNAYQEFLRTSNLNRLDDSTQIEILVGIYARMLREEIAATQQNISELKQENTLTPVPTQITIYVNSEIEMKLAELRQILDDNQHRNASMDVINGRAQRIYQDWVKINPAVYSAILGSRYTNDLNAILKGYGL